MVIVCGFHMDSVQFSVSLANYCTQTNFYEQIQLKAIKPREKEPNDVFFFHLKVCSYWDRDKCFPDIFPFAMSHEFIERKYTSEF